MRCLRCSTQRAPVCCGFGGPCVACAWRAALVALVLCSSLTVCSGGLQSFFREEVFNFIGYQAKVGLLSPVLPVLSAVARHHLLLSSPQFESSFLAFRSLALFLFFVWSWCGDSPFPPLLISSSHAATHAARRRQQHQIWPLKLQRTLLRRAHAVFAALA